MATDAELPAALHRGIAAGDFIEVTDAWLDEHRAGLDFEPWEDIDL